MNNINASAAGYTRITHVKSVVQVKIVMSIEVTSNKIIDLCLGRGVQVLEFVHSLEFDDVETIWYNTVRLALQ